MSFEFWFLYVSTVFVASIIPGPSMILALTHGIKHGTKKTLYTAAGNTTASLLQASLAILGLGVLLQSSLTLFLAVKYLGAAYLIYLGFKLFRSGNFEIHAQDEQTSANAQGKKMFNEAFFIALANPKAVVFFTALFPQFLNTQTGGIVQYSILLSSLAVVAFLCMMLYAVSGKKIAFLFQKELIKRYFNKVVGAGFIGFGLTLLSKKQ